MELKTQKYSASLKEWTDPQEKTHTLFAIHDNVTDKDVMKLGKTKVLALKAVLTEFIRYAESLEKSEKKRLEEAEKKKAEVSKKVVEVGALF